MIRLTRKGKRKGGRRKGGKKGGRNRGKKHKAREKWVCGVYVHITLSATVSDTLCVPLEIK